MKKYFLIIVSLFTIISSQAQRKNLIFKSSFEDPTLSDWKTSQYCNSTEISSNNKNVRYGKYSARFYSTITDTSSCVNNRSQLIFADTSAIKYERWYGFSLYLGAGYPTLYDGVENLFEFFRTDSTEEHPPLALSYSGYYTGISTRWSSGTYLSTYNHYRSDTATIKYSPYTIFISPVGPVQMGKWFDVVIHAKFANDTSGLFTIWVNDTLSYNYKGPNNFGPNKLRIGIDKWDWRMRWYVSSTSSRELYIDEFYVGNALATYNDVRPTISKTRTRYTRNLTTSKTSTGQKSTLTISNIPSQIPQAHNIISAYIPFTSASQTSALTSVQLDWEALVSDDFQNFIVERADNDKFNNSIYIGTVAKNDFGTSYQFFDNNPVMFNFYRIKSVAPMEESVYSNVAFMRYYNGPSNITLYDLSGRLLLKKRIIDISNIKNEINVPPGMYIASYDNGYKEKIFIGVQRP
jgi:hypothetical protein